MVFWPCRILGDWHGSIYAVRIYHLPGSCNHQNLIGNTKMLSHGSAKITSEKRERRDVIKKKSTKMKSLQYIIDLLGP